MAADTLIFPILLDASARVESVSPVSGATIRLAISPTGDNIEIVSLAEGMAYARQVAAVFGVDW